MDEELLEFEHLFDRVINEAQTLCFLPRASEIQRGLLERLAVIKTRCIDLKMAYALQGKENIANQLLCAENILQSFIKELDMWLLLKEDNPDDAWSALIDAQLSALTAVRSHEVGHSMASRLRRLELLEKMVFPPQVFLSTGFICEYSTCSICGEEYGICDHIQGRPYGGEMCVRVIHDANLREVSVVDSPASKHCRVMVVPDPEHGVSREVMTWRAVTRQDASDPWDAVFKVE